MPNSVRNSAKYYKDNKQTISAQRRNKRINNIPATILTDSIRAARKRGFENDLDLAFITTSIANGCIYCGETSVRMSLDRIDNAFGHLRNNIVAACVRCNFIRRDMPYEAWLIVVPSMRLARELDLFGDWTGGVWNRREQIQVPPTRLHTGYKSAATC